MTFMHGVTTDLVGGFGGAGHPQVGAEVVQLCCRHCLAHPLDHRLKLC
jgi:hypothetical protein